MKQRAELLQKQVNFDISDIRNLPRQARTLVCFLISYIVSYQELSFYKYVTQRLTEDRAG